jgi:serine O-acetyltransferase
MTQPREWLVRAIWLDMKLILAYWNRPQNLRNVLWALFACDGFIILMMFRIRQWFRRHHIPLVNRIIRFMETAFFSIELGNDVELGRGVFFMHSVGTVVGGDAKIGDACVFLGNNTIGASGEPGCPRIGARTVIGAGARVLGKIEIGEGCILGANAEVVHDVPAGKVAMGIPARVTGDAKQTPRATAS